jgi:carboxylesterase
MRVPLDHRLALRQHNSEAPSSDEGNLDATSHPKGLPEVLAAVAGRLKQEAAPASQESLWAAAKILMVLNDPDEQVEPLIEGITKRLPGSALLLRLTPVKMMLSDPPSTVSQESPTSDPGRPSCLVLHGLGGGAYELGPIIAALEAEGLPVSAPVLPGHEGPGPVMPSSCWRDWAATAEAVFDDLAAAGRPVVVVGFSTGALLALYLAGRRPVARLVLLAPFLAIRFSRLIPLRPAVYLGPLARVIPNLRRRPPAVRDREMRRQVAASAFYRTFSVGAALSALELIEEVEPIVPRIMIPTLILQGKLDTVVEPRNATWLRDHLGSTRKALVILPRSDHLVGLDRDRERVVSLTRDFVLGRGEVFEDPNG